MRIVGPFHLLAHGGSVVGEIAMKSVWVFTCCLTLASHDAYAKFNPSGTMIAHLAQRFKETMQKSGFIGVGQDVLKCYDDSLGNDDATKECVVYDVAALMLDRQMQQVFVARGMNPSPSPLYTNQAFDARSHTYGFPAFHGDEAEKKLIGPAAKRVLDQAFSRN